jgi:plastocyanin
VKRSMLAGVVLAGALAPLGPILIAPRRHVVEIRGMAFHPAVLEVQRGDTVVWINRDFVSHTATATRKAGWSTGPLVPGQDGRYVAGGKGEEPYFCELHPPMRGTLIVR